MSKLSDQGSIWLATGLGVGLVSPAPGTVGGLWGIPLAWAIGISGPVELQAALILLVGVVGVLVCSRAAQALGGSKDPQSIVLDEIAALPVVFLGTGPMTAKTCLLGYLFFRIADISKPPPARQLEQLPSGLGIMADDFAAAIYACGALHGVLWVTSWTG